MSTPHIDTCHWAVISSYLQLGCEKFLLTVKIWQEVMHEDSYDTKRKTKRGSYQDRY